MYATGTFPAHTLDGPDEQMIQSAAALTDGLKKGGFTDTGIWTTWRRHNLWIGGCGLMSRTVQPGEVVCIPGEKLDYVVMVKEL